MKGKKRMILNRLVIKCLHDLYDYDIKLNPTLNLLYGNNGCGKTTILNIIESIITGNIKNLLKYSFKSIKLYYNDLNKENNTNNYISIEYVKDKIELKGSNLFYNELIDSESPQIDEISNIFSYVYLPLNRDSNINGGNIRARHAHPPVRINANTALEHACQLVVNESYHISSEKQYLDNKFRNDILDAMIFLQENRYSVNQMLDKIKDMDIYLNNLDKIEKGYLRALSSFNLLKNTKEEEVHTFFESYKTEFQQQNINTSSVPADLFVKFTEISKAQMISEKALALYSNIERLNTRITLLTEILNSFFATSNDKEVYINDKGFLRIKSLRAQKDIPIIALSSGERQIIIFFTTLILELQGDKYGIFIEDEPELSLHISWQRDFIRNALKANNNAQLIFATHSPSILSGHENYAVQIEQTIHEEK